MRRRGVVVLMLVVLVGLACAGYGLVLTIGQPQCRGGAMIAGTVCREGGERLTYQEKRDHNRQVGLVLMPLGLTVGLVASGWTFLRLARRGSDTAKLRTSSRGLEPKPEGDAATALAGTAYAAQIAQVAPKPGTATSARVRGPAATPEGSIGAAPPGWSGTPPERAPALASAAPPPPVRPSVTNQGRRNQGAGLAWAVVAGLVVATTATALVVVHARSEAHREANDPHNPQGLLRHLAGSQRARLSFVDGPGGLETFSACGKEASNDARRAHRVTFHPRGVFQVEIIQYEQGAGRAAIAEVRKALLACPSERDDDLVGGTVQRSAAPPQYERGLVADHLGWLTAYTSDLADALAEGEGQTLTTGVLQLVQRRGDVIVVVSGSDPDEVHDQAVAIGRRLDALDPHDIRAVRDAG